MPAAVSAPPALSHFDQGRRAFRQGQYELTLREMMMVIIERPADARAREYMRQAGERLIAQDLEKLDSEHRALLQAYREALERGRRQAEAWTGWLLQARASASSGLWARAYDDAQRVLDENPFHADAKATQNEAVLGVARTLGGDVITLSKKNWLIYRGLFFLRDRQLDQAREALRKALTLGSTAAELGDERVRLYLARATPAPVLAPIQIQPPLPPAPAPVARPRPVVRRAPTPTLQPGQWAYAQGSAKLAAGLFEEAIDLFERAIEEAPHHEAARQALPRARLALEESVKQRRVEAEQLYVLGLMLYGQGRRADAVERWGRAVSLDPEHGYAARALSHARQELEEEQK
jgi:tetratricopeptide (TPR) repeat protein